MCMHARRDDCKEALGEAGLFRPRKAPMMVASYTSAAVDWNLCGCGLLRLFCCCCSVDALWSVRCVVRRALPLCLLCLLCLLFFCCNCCKVTRLRGFHMDVEALSHPGIGDGSSRQPKNPRQTASTARLLDISLSTDIFALGSMPIFASCVLNRSPIFSFINQNLTYDGFVLCYLSCITN